MGWRLFVTKDVPRMRLSIDKRWLPYITLGITLITFSFSPIIARGSVAPAPVFGFYRMTLGLLFISPFLVRQRQRQVQARAGFRWRYLIFPILGGVSNALDLGTWYTSLHFTRVANATLLNNVAPLWVALVAWIFFKEKLKPVFWLGLILALGGSAVIIGSDFILHPSFNSGNLIAMLSSLFFAAYYIFVQKGRLYFGATECIVVMTVVSSVLMLGYTLISGIPLTGYPLDTYIFMALSALSTQAIGLYANSYTLGHLPASVVAPTLILQVVSSAVLALFIFGETMQSWQWLGGMVVIIGIILVIRSQQSETVSQPAPAD